MSWFHSWHCGPFSVSDVAFSFTREWERYLSGQLTSKTARVQDTHLHHKYVRKWAAIDSLFADLLSIPVKEADVPVYRCNAETDSQGDIELVVVPFWGGIVPPGLLPDPLSTAGTSGAFSPFTRKLAMLLINRSLPSTVARAGARKSVSPTAVTFPLCAATV